MNNQSKQLAQEVLRKAGITINGSRSWDMQVNNERTYQRVIRSGSLGLGESFMEGWWDVQDIEEFFFKIIKANLSAKVREDKRLIFNIAKDLLFNPQSKGKSLIVGRTHYDLGNDLFKAMLDKRLVYTCGYWKDAKNLDQAQDDKLELVCKKIGLKKGMKVLDIGCGFGSFAKYAAEKYKVTVDGITISHEQISLGKKLCQGLPVKLEFKDYRDITGTYDRIVSLGMFEHVGHKNYRNFMKIVHKHLKDNGFFLLHTIGANDSSSTKEAWLEKYIFPNSELPTIFTIGKSIEELFTMEDWHNFSADYEKTLLAWFENFDRNWKGLGNKYDQTFYRMWKYYLLMCAASFKARKNQLWQIVLSKNGVINGYKSVR